MEYGYYPGCSLTGSAHKLDKGIRKVFAKAGHTLKEIPGLELLRRVRIRRPKGTCRFFEENLEKARGHLRRDRRAVPGVLQEPERGGRGKRSSASRTRSIFSTRRFSRAMKQGRDLRGRSLRPITDASCCGRRRRRYATRTSWKRRSPASAARSRARR